MCQGFSPVFLLTHFLIDPVMAFTCVMEEPWHIEGQENSKWVLMDYVDIVVHVFNEETREYYKIEELWEEADSTLVNTNY